MSAPEILSDLPKGRFGIVIVPLVIAERLIVQGARKGADIFVRSAQTFGNIAMIVFDRRRDELKHREVDK